ncbi:MAG: aminotransferase class IV [Phycisphaerales bacterium]
MTAVFLNGVFTTLDGTAGGPVLSALDAGVQHGVGLFETVLAGCAGEGGTRPWALHLEEHLARLVSSARELGLSNDLRDGPLGDAVLATVARSGLARARVRVTVTGGDLNMLARGGRGGAAHDPTVLIVAQPATAYPPGMLEQGVLVTVATARANPMNPDEGHKTLNYWWRLRELQGAGAKGAAEALVFSVGNHLVGGCVSNVLLVRGGKVLTPTARGEESAGGPSAVRPGVTRGWALESAAGEGAVHEKRACTIDDLLGADEVMLTNSSWGVLPVTRVEGKAIGAGGVGPVARALVASWGREVERCAALA